MKRTLLLPGIILALSALITPAADRLAAGFADPPPDTRPWCYWYWISDNISKEGITRDLEAMARVGIGEAFIGNIFLDDVRSGEIKVLAPEWWELVEHAIREGGRTGVNIGMFNCPGWSQSGGPWIKPEQSMRYLVSSETRVSGPGRFTRQLPAPQEQFQDVAVLAFPAPEDDHDSIRNRFAADHRVPPRWRAWSGLPTVTRPQPSSFLAMPAEVTTLLSSCSSWMRCSLRARCRSSSAVKRLAQSANCKPSAQDGGWQTLRRFKCDRSNMSTGVGFMPRGPVTVSFPATSSKRFRLVFTGFFGGGKPKLAEVDLSGAARLESFVEKQLGKMHPTPLPMWDTYLWPTQAEPDSARLVVPAGGVQRPHAARWARTARWLGTSRPASGSSSASG